MPDDAPTRPAARRCPATPRLRRAAAACCLAAVALAVAPTALPAADPSTSRPASASKDGESSPQRRDRGRDHDGEARPDRPERRDPTEEEWQQTVSFLREHSPRRLELLEEYAARSRQSPDAQPANPDAAPTTRPAASPWPRIRSRIFGRVESMRDLSRSDPSLYAFVLRQFQLEDAMIGGLLDARQARDRGEPAVERTADAAVDDAVRGYVESAFAEREARIDRLRRDLAEEEQRLDRDRGRMDEMMRHLRSRYERYVPDDAPNDDGPVTRPAAQ